MSAECTTISSDDLAPTLDPPQAGDQDDKSLEQGTDLEEKEMYYSERADFKSHNLRRTLAC